MFSVPEGHSRRCSWLKQGRERPSGTKRRWRLVIPGMNPWAIGVSPSGTKSYPQLLALTLISGLHRCFQVVAQQGQHGVQTSEGLRRVQIFLGQNLFQAFDLVNLLPQDTGGGIDRQGFALSFQTRFVVRPATK